MPRCRPGTMRARLVLSVIATSLAVCPVLAGEQPTVEDIISALKPSMLDQDRTRPVGGWANLGLMQPVAAAPDRRDAPAAAAPAEQIVRFSEPLTTGPFPVNGQSLEQLVQGTPLFPPIEGLPCGRRRAARATNGTAERCASRGLPTSRTPPQHKGIPPLWGRREAGHDAVGKDRLPMRQELPLRVLLKYAAFAFAIACGGSADAQEWLLNAGASRFYMQTVKANSIFEVHQFTGLDGSIATTAMRSSRST
jgi:hypothetical protein